MSQTDSRFTDRIHEVLAKLKAGEADAEWLTPLVEWLLQELLELDFSDYLGAAPYERTANRRGYRNGHRLRQLTTRVGALTLHVPRDRAGRFSPALFGRYERSEKALVLALQEMYLQGVSTRKVRTITEALCGTTFSKDQVSALAQRLDAQLEAWRTRPLDEPYPYLVVDATYEKVREDGQIRSQGVLLVKGVRADGYRELLAVVAANTENATTWAEVCKALKRRGLRGVHYVVSDDHEGLGQALARHFQGVLWQRCQVHYLRNATNQVPTRERPALREQLKDAWEAPDRATAQQRLARLVEHYKRRFMELTDWLEETLEETLTVFALPKAHRRRMRSTNGLERIHQELKRRTRVVRIFPNRASCLRLVSALAMEQSEEWLTGHRYLDMSLLEDARKEEPRSLEESREKQSVAVAHRRS
ncbi:MAG: IS256 family transposase [Anaerolineae bacterium]